MQKGNEILEELNGMQSPLAAMPRTMPYSVPAGYFDQLPDDIKAIAAAEVPSMVTQHGNAYDVPAGYFDTLPLQMLKAAKESEQEKVDSNNIPLKPAKKIALVPQIRIAAAAAIALIISFGAYITFSGNAESQPDKMLSSIPGNEIKDYVTHRYGLDPMMIVPGKEVNSLNVDSKDIVAYLDATGWD